MDRALYSAKLNDAEAARGSVERVTAKGELNPDLLFRAAVIWELIGKRDRALMSLSQAIQRGYSREQVSKEPELAALRKDPRFLERDPKRDNVSSK